MGTAAVKSRWARPHEREATRLAILDAAKGLAARDGLSDLTLSAVASEAGIARATIYGYFSGKQDLLSQLSGEDGSEQADETTQEPSAEESIAASAEEPVAIADEIPVTPADADEDACETPDDEDASVTLVEEFIALPQDPPADVADESVQPFAEDESLSAEAPGEFGAMMRLQAQELDSLAKRIIVPKSLMKEGTDAAISRLGTRLTLVEQSISKLEINREDDAKNVAARIASALEAVQHLQKRLEKFNMRQEQAFAELRLDFHNLTNQVARDRAPNDETVQSLQFVPTPPPLQVAPDVPDAHANPEKADSYISSARRAAIYAAEHSVGEEHVSALRPWRRWLMGAVVLAAFGLGGFFSLRSGIATVPAIVHPAVVHAAAKTVPAKDRLAALAAAGNAQAQLVLGLEFLNGTNSEMNVAKAAGWLERAANGGQPVAQNYLGALYQTGTGVKTDMAKAIRWYRAAAVAGNRKAMTDLGKAYAGGWTEGTDYALAAHWFAQAANLGDADAQFDLAVLYERGDGVVADKAVAYKWYALAAAQGDRGAAQQAAILADQLSPDDLRKAKLDLAGFKPEPLNPAANVAPTRAAIRAARD